MPWQETGPVEKRFDFVAAVRRGETSVSKLCETYGVSRKTGYKWLTRFKSEGLRGLEEKSRARHEQAHRVSAGVERRLLALKQKYPTLGPKKLVSILRSRHPGVAFCAPSTAGDVLKRHGLVERRPRRGKRSSVPPAPLRPVTRPNGTWSADFKGDFGLKDGSRCYPLTLTDNFSRYLLGCRALPGINMAPARAVFERVFREYGLPDVIRTDNGTPFASNQGGLGLSSLAVWWLRLGIHPECIERGKPQQNGRHERMHRTLKADTVVPTAAHLQEQQRRFDTWRHFFNHERPHEALRQTPPASVYEQSKRRLPEALPELEYRSGMQVRRVAMNGMLSYSGHRYRVSKTLALENIGLEPIADAIVRLWLGSLSLGFLDLETARVVPCLEHQDAA